MGVACRKPLPYLWVFLLCFLLLTFCHLFFGGYFWGVFVLPGNFGRWMGVACRAIQLQPLSDLCAHNFWGAWVRPRQVESGAGEEIFWGLKNVLKYSKCQMWKENDILIKTNSESKSWKDSSSQDSCFASFASGESLGYLNILNVQIYAKMSTFDIQTKLRFIHFQGTQWFDSFYCWYLSGSK